MISIARILCPVDFSEFSRRALDYSIGIARWYGANVTALHVCPITVNAPAIGPAPGAFVPTVASPVDMQLLRDMLKNFVAAEAAEGVRIDMQVIEAPVVQEIVAQAQLLPADLLVLGTHGRSGVERVLLGSVTEKLLHQAPCPVLTVPRAAADAVPVAPGLFTRILCPTDFSPASDAAVKWALAIAQEAQADLLLLHVFEVPAVSAQEAFPRSTLAAYRREYEQWCTAQLRSAVPADARTWCSVQELTASGSAHREIRRIAAERACDLIVMGVGQSRGLADRVLGSTSQHVVRSASCPVLTVRERANP